MRADGGNVSGGAPALDGGIADGYRLIGEGTEGDDVLALKKRLKTLGYFTAKAETGAYNEARWRRPSRRTSGPAGWKQPALPIPVAGGDLGTQGKAPYPAGRLCPADCRSHRTHAHARPGPAIAWSCPR